MLGYRKITVNIHSWEGMWILCHISHRKLCRKWKIYWRTWKTMMAWNYVSELVFNMLVLVDTVKMSDQVVRKMFWPEAVIWWSSSRTGYVIKVVGIIALICGDFFAPIRSLCAVCMKIMQRDSMRGGSTMDKFNKNKNTEQTFDFPLYFYFIFWYNQS